MPDGHTKAKLGLLVMTRSTNSGVSKHWAQITTLLWRVCGGSIVCGSVVIHDLVLVVPRPNEFNFPPRMRGGVSGGLAPLTAIGKPGGARPEGVTTVSLRIAPVKARTSINKPLPCTLGHQHVTKSQFAHQMRKAGFCIA